MRGSFSKSKIHPCLTVVPFWQLLHLRVFILMGIPVFVPLRSALNAGPLDLQRPHALVFDITDVFWLPLKKWSQQHRYKWKGQPFLLMLASLSHNGVSPKKRNNRNSFPQKPFLRTAVFHDHIPQTHLFIIANI